MVTRNETILSTRLYGGHRNQVFRTDGIVKIIWKDGFLRKSHIREGVTLENFVATHTDIRARMLVDKAKPVQEEHGNLVTYFQYADGEIRYPWSLKEIASAARLLATLHEHLKVRPFGSERSDLDRQLHLDFARGNILFQPGTSDAVGVIDFETTASGPVEQELGRTLRFLLVDSPWDQSFNFQFSIFNSRLYAFLTNYGLPYRREEVLKFAQWYLVHEDYGSLNTVRDKAIVWLKTI